MKRQTKRFVSLLMVAAMMISLIATSAGTVSAKTDGNTVVKQTEEITYDFGLPENSKSGIILHAWNWYFKDVTERMEEIARAGYKTVQISPVQLSKEDGEYLNTENNWWKLYQPLNFEVGNFLGSKKDFKALCDEAHKYGINIIVDVVTNHMAGGSSGINGNCSDEINLMVRVDGEDVNIINVADAWHDKDKVNSDDAREDMVQGSIGMPDLDTSSEMVQELVQGLLRECVDLGADGFRYDALKHIETDTEIENNLRSTFWQNTAGYIKNYASETYGKELYQYGEVIAPVYPSVSDSTLNKSNNKVILDGYLKYLDGLTDVASAYWLREDIMLGKINQLYANGDGCGTYCGIKWQGFTNVSDLVMWVESHDTYAEDTAQSGDGYLSTKPLSDNDIKLGWAMTNSRKEVTTLFFVRPIAFSNEQSSYFGADGVTQLYLDEDITAINHFHNYFASYANENVTGTLDGTIYSVERKNTDTNVSGIVITNIGTKSTNASVTLATGTKFANGTYTDIMSGNSCTVSSGKVTGTLPAKSFAILYSNNTNPVSAIPEVTISQEGGQFTGTLELSLALNNAVSGTYKIGNGAPQEITEDQVITIGEDVEAGEFVALTLTATGETTSVEKTYVFTKLAELVEEDKVVYFIYTGKKDELPSKVTYHFDNIIKHIGEDSIQDIDGTIVEINGETEISATENLVDYGFDLGINYVQQKYASDEYFRIFKAAIPSGYEYGRVHFTIGTKRIPAESMVLKEGSTVKYNVVDFNLYNMSMVCFDFRKGYEVEAYPYNENMPYTEDYKIVSKNSYAANINGLGGYITNNYTYDELDTSVFGTKVDYNTNRKQFLLGSVIRSTAQENSNIFNGWYDVSGDEPKLITMSKSIILPVYQDLQIEARYNIDINSDGNLNLLDAYIILLDDLTEDQVAAADFNKDEKATVADVSILLSYLTGKISSVNSSIYSFSATAGENGTISGTANGTYDKNTQITLTAIPDVENGYHFKGWYDNGRLVSTSETLSFKLTKDISYTAIFSNTYTVTYSAGGNGSVTAAVDGETINNPSEVADNTTVTFTAIAESSFNGWYVNGVEVTDDTVYTMDEDEDGNSTLTFSITSDVNVVAKFANSTTVYFSTYWKGVNIYAWNDATGNAMTTWNESPRMTFVDTNSYGQSIYSYDLPSEFDMIIFRDSSSTNQSVDIPRSEEHNGYYVDNQSPYYGYYDYIEGSDDPDVPTTYTVNYSVKGTGEVIATAGEETFTSGSKFEKGTSVTLTAVADEEPFAGWYVNGTCISEDEQYTFDVSENISIIAQFGEIDVSSGSTVYFSTYWTNVKIYAWNKTTGKTMTTWNASESMTQVDTNSYGQKIFSYDLPEEYDMIIFRDASSAAQSVDIPRSTEHNGYYTSDIAPYYGYYDYVASAT